MMIKKGKIGSALAAFESNISKNEQYGTSNKSFIAGITSPRNFRIRPAPSCIKKDMVDQCKVESLERSQSPTCSMTEDDGEDDVLISVPPKSPIKKRAGFGMLPAIRKGPGSPVAEEVSNNAVERSSSSEIRHCQPEKEKEVNPERNCKRDRTIPLEDARTDCIVCDESSVRDTEASLTTDTRSLSPTPELIISSSDIPSPGRTPKPLTAASHKRTVSIPPGRSRSPNIRTRNAIRNQISVIRSPVSAPMAPQRQISDPDDLRMSETPIAKPAEALEDEPRPPPSPVSSPSLRSPKRRQKNLIAARTGNYEVELKKKKQEELREQARQYDAAQHGLKGILKWDLLPQKSGRRIRWAAILTHHSDAVQANGRNKDRRTSLEFTMGTNSASADQLKQPRRRSMSDFDKHVAKADPPAFLVHEGKSSRATTLLLAAFKASLWQPGTQFREFRAACCLQAIARRFLVQNHMPVVRLEHQLRVIERQRVSDLNQIQEKKWRRMETAREKADSRTKQQETRYEKSQELVKCLREQNSRLETKAREYESKSKMFKTMNDQLEASTKQIESNVAILTESLEILKNHNDMLELQCEELARAVDEILAHKDKVDQKYRVEHRVKSEMEQVLRSIVMTVSIRSDDMALVHEIKTLHAVLVVERKHDSAENYLDSSSTTYGDDGSKLDQLSILSGSASRLALPTSAMRGLDIDARSFISMDYDDDDDMMTVCTADSFLLEQ